MIWTTCTYTLTTTNSLSVKRQMNSVKTFKGLYGKNPKNTTMKISCVQEPHEKGGKIHDSQKKDSKRWLGNGGINGENQLYNRMKTLAYEEFSHKDFNREEYDSYSLVLYRTMLNELEYERRNLKYINLFGEKWRKMSRKQDNFTHEDRLTEIQVRIYESVTRCEEFLDKERKFKKKYFFLKCIGGLKQIGQYT